MARTSFSDKRAGKNSTSDSHIDTKIRLQDDRRTISDNGFVEISDTILGLPFDC